MAADHPPRWVFWCAHLVANAVAGLAAGAGWPFVYFAGYAIATQAGLIVGDPTVTDDGVGLTIGLGVVALVIVLGAFLALNGVVGRWAGDRAARRLPSAIIIALLVALCTTRLWYH